MLTCAQRSFSFFEIYAKNKRAASRNPCRGPAMTRTVFCFKTIRQVQALMPLHIRHDESVFVNQSLTITDECYLSLWQMERLYTSHIEIFTFYFISTFFSFSCFSLIFKSKTLLCHDTCQAKFRIICDSFRLSGIGTSKANNLQFACTVSQ